MAGDEDDSPVKPCYLNILENEQPLNSAAPKDSLTIIDSSKQPDPLPLPLTEIETLVPRVKEVKSAQETPESSLAGSPDTESPVLVNDYVCIIYNSIYFGFLFLRTFLYIFQHVNQTPLCI
jgi:pericentriolar material 1 protein